MEPSALAATSRLFSAALIQEFATKGSSKTFASLFNQTELNPNLASSALVKDVFELAFDALKKTKYRNEYSYKAALIQKILLGRHSIKSATLLTEFRVGKCKADLAILNGTSSVYEIKSERDSLIRLESQIGEYRKFFAKVNVVVAECHLKEVLKTLSDDVGILLLSERFQLSKIRDATENISRMDLNTVFDSLRIEESIKVLSSLDIRMPKMPNTLIYEAAKKLFISQNKSDIHEKMVNVLKVSRNSINLTELLNNLPKSLQPLILTTSIRKKDHSRLLSAINTPIVEALKWN